MGGFLSKSPNGARESLEDLADKTIQQETIKDDNLNFTVLKKGIFVVCVWEMCLGGSLAKRVA